MASNMFDLRELDALDKDLLKLANSSMPRESKKFIRGEGTKLKRVVVKRAKSDVGKDTGNYIKGIKKGKVYKYRGNDAWSIRVYGSAAHTHLIEYGHRMIGHKPNKKECGFVQGKHVFENSAKDFESTYVNDVGKFVDQVIVGGLKK